MPALIVLALVSHLLVVGDNTGKTPSLPSSDAVAVAAAAAIEWDPKLQGKDIYQDIVGLSPQDNSDYLTVIVYSGSQSLLTIRIDVWTGQVVEPNRCLYFGSSDIEDFGRQVRTLTHHSEYTLPALAEKFGCDVLTLAGHLSSP